ncbi:type VI secretion system-associated protein TagF [Photobacterium lutimaris]|uniref:Type VI secretion system-associated protein TagF n=1 Tax=Photobacterium lutimaris TaxID=388278 RepID=A0A2T3IZM5_9GAMM|nr:type VI secretion system-associated protein TagF [Photobacterium lutimaris]PSU34131.1 type VI secretion system-associated protein TagF [Photobacterium lutimaris]TDR75702.1 type VI secretion system protein ImpM [Photobacterium lutimaris]
MSDNLVKSKFGYFGKVPVRGDFIQDQLPADFIESWNEWLQATLAVSREQLADNWLDCYLTSPIWHFALSPGVCGESAIVGTLMPSVDRVGRHYYFTLASPVEHPISAFWEQKQWSQESEELVLKLLDDETDFASWVSELNQNMWFGGLPTVGTDTRIVDTEQSNHRVLINEGHIESSHMLHLAYRERYDRYCLWWTSGSERVPACTLITSGLPFVGQFSAMLDGCWEEWGW